MRFPRRRIWAVLAVVVSVGVAGGGPSATDAGFGTGDRVVAGPASVPDDAGLTGRDIVAAKVGLGRFLVEHIDRPLRVAAPCPTVDAAAAGWWLQSVGLGLTTRDFGVAIAWDDDVGGGLVVVRCGVDLNRSSDPPESVRWSLDVGMLDGQATFAQLAVDLAGRDAEVSAANVDGLTGEIVSRCRNGSRDCDVAVGVDDLVVVLRLEGLPSDTGELLSRSLATQVVPSVVRNLAAVPPP